MRTLEDYLREIYPHSFLFLHEADAPDARQILDSGLQVRFNHIYKNPEDALHTLAIVPESTTIEEAKKFIERYRYESDYDLPVTVVFAVDKQTIAKPEDINTLLKRKKLTKEEKNSILDGTRRRCFKFNPNNDRRMDSARITVERGFVNYISPEYILGIYSRELHSFEANPSFASTSHEKEGTNQQLAEESPSALSTLKHLQDDKRMAQNGPTTDAGKATNFKK